jgi:ABC-type multidrug transport system ATPase subunit
LKELIQIVGEKDIALINGTFKAEEARAALKDVREAEILILQDEKLMLSVRSQEDIPAILEKLFKAGYHLDGISIKQPNLESVFLKLTGKELRE